MLKNEDKKILQQLNKYFPKTVSTCPRQGNRVRRKLHEAEQSFRRFLLTLTANASQRRMYLQRSYHREYGEEFFDKMEMLASQFLHHINILLPATTLEKLIVSNPHCLKAKLSLVHSRPLEVLRELILHKHSLTEDFLLKHVQCLLRQTSSPTCIIVDSSSSSSVKLISSSSEDKADGLTGGFHDGRGVSTPRRWSSPHSTHRKRRLERGHNPHDLQGNNGCSAQHSRVNSDGLQGNSGYSAQHSGVNSDGLHDNNGCSIQHSGANSDGIHDNKGVISGSGSSSGGLHGNSGGRTGQSGSSTDRSESLFSAEVSKPEAGWKTPHPVSERTDHHQTNHQDEVLSPSHPDEESPAPPSEKDLLSDLSDKDLSVERDLVPATSEEDMLLQSPLKVIHRETPTKDVSHAVSYKNLSADMSDNEPLPKPSDEILPLSICNKDPPSCSKDSVSPSHVSDQALSPYKSNEPYHSDKGFSTYLSDKDLSPDHSDKDLSPDHSHKDLSPYHSDKHLSPDHSDMDLSPDHYDKDLSPVLARQDLPSDPAKKGLILVSSKDLPLDQVNKNLPNVSLETALSPDPAGRDLSYVSSQTALSRVYTDKDPSHNSTDKEKSPDHVDQGLGPTGQDLTVAPGERELQTDSSDEELLPDPTDDELEHEKYSQLDQGATDLDQSYRVIEYSSDSVETIPGDCAEENTSEFIISSSPRVKSGKRRKLMEYCSTAKLRGSPDGAVCLSSQENERPDSPVISSQGFKPTWKSLDCMLNSCTDCRLQVREEIHSTPRGVDIPVTIVSFDKSSEEESFGKECSSCLPTDKSSPYGKPDSSASDIFMNSDDEKTAEHQKELTSFTRIKNHRNSTYKLGSNDDYFENVTCRRRDEARRFLDYSCHGDDDYGTDLKKQQSELRNSRKKTDTMVNPECNQNLTSVLTENASGNSNLSSAGLPTPVIWISSGSSQGSSQNSQQSEQQGSPILSAGGVPKASYTVCTDRHSDQIFALNFRTADEPGLNVEADVIESSWSEGSQDYNIPSSNTEEQYLPPSKYNTRQTAKYLHSSTLPDIAVHLRRPTYSEDFPAEKRPRLA